MASTGHTPCSPTGRTERLIAAARAVLAVFFLLAVWLDPTEPVRFAPLARHILSGYAVYTLLSAAFMWRMDPSWSPLRFATHAVDLAVFTALMFLTEGPNSPFFVYFIFLLVCAALRWQWRGTLWTAASALGLISFMAWDPFAVFADGAFEMNRFIIRAAYLAVVAALLGYLGAHEAERRRVLSRLAASEERILLARDLHDGILQTLTGAALRLETVRRTLDSDPEGAGRSVGEVCRILSDGQQDLRSQIRLLKPAQGAPAEDFDLAARLGSLTEQMRRQWGLRVDIKLKPYEHKVEGTMARHIYYVVQEAMVNAAKHAGATALRARLSLDGDMAAISVADNGHGFPFRGFYDNDRLFALKRGPVNLKERLAALGGTISIDSRESGSRLEMTVPLTSPGA